MFRMMTFLYYKQQQKKKVAIQILMASLFLGVTVCILFGIFLYNTFLVHIYFLRYKTHHFRLKVVAAGKQHTHGAWSQKGLGSNSNSAMIRKPECLHRICL